MRTTKFLSAAAGVVVGAVVGSILAAAMAAALTVLIWLAGGIQPAAAQTLPPYDDYMREQQAERRAREAAQELRYEYEQKRWADDFSRRLTDPDYEPRGNYCTHEYDLDC